jgi:hypothetical protein
MVEKVTFSKKEQELIIEMFMRDRFKISPNGQKIYKSKFFFDVMCDLKKMGLIRSFKIGNKTNYQLTDEGIMLGYLLSRKSDKAIDKKIWYVFDIFFTGS